MWQGLFVREGWPLRSLTVNRNDRGCCVLRPALWGVSVKAETLPTPRAGEEVLSLEWTQGG